MEATGARASGIVGIVVNLAVGGFLLVDKVVPKEEEKVGGDNLESVSSKRRFSPKKVLVLIVVVAVLAVGGYLLHRQVFGSSTNTVKGPATAPFTIKKAAGWTQLSKAQVARLSGPPPLAVLKRQGKGVLTVRLSGKVGPNLNRVFGDLTNKLKKRFSDFQKTSSKVIEIKSGRAYLYSYARKSNGSVNTIVVVPAGNRSFTISSLFRGGANDVAPQIAEMISSFKAQ